MSTAVVWFVYCAGVALLLALAAHAAEAASRAMGRPGRWAWIFAMALTVLVPAASWLGWRTWSSPVPALSTPLILTLPALTVSTGGATRGPDATTLLVIAWVIASTMLLARIVVDFARLNVARRSWRREVISGVAVLVTPDLGPAVFGLSRTSILLPAWALSIDEDLRHLMLLHEREHVHAHDPSLLATALLLVVVMPWNPLLWMQLHRLRLAVEMDCDARVLRHVPDMHGYGALLLEVGRRRASPIAVLAMSEPVTFLEQRIRAFTRIAGRHAGRRALALGTAAAGLVVLAVCTRDPISHEPIPTTDQLAVTSEAPMFTPYTLKPQLKNPAQVQAALRVNYPPLIRDAGISGSTIFWFYIDETGRTIKTQVHQSSGYPQLDAAAARVAELMEFTPARNRDRPVAVWVQIPIQFMSAAPADDLEPPAGISSERFEVTPSEQGPDGPRFTPYTVQPRLLNPPEVQRALQENYPPLLRDAGIGGMTVLWFHIGTDGRVTDVRVATGSSHEALDRAAVAVGRTMQFSPAMNRDKPVDVWVQIPVTFSSK
jgi:TonB family protein